VGAFDEKKKKSKISCKCTFKTGNLQALRNILEEYSEECGLKCNFDKTMVVPAGTAINQQIDTAGSMVTNKIKLLGLEITNTADGFEPNFVAICEQIPTMIIF
jgi:hypothetical protein